MELIYSALLLDSVGKKVTEENVKKVLEGAGVKADESRVKALVASLEGVNIKEVIAQAAMPTVQVAPAAKEEKVKEKKEGEGKKEEEKEAEATAGLASLFG